MCASYTIDFASIFATPAPLPASLHTPKSLVLFPEPWNALVTLSPTTGRTPTMIAALLTSRSRTLPLRSACGGNADYVKPKPAFTQSPAKPPKPTTALVVLSNHPSRSASDTEVFTSSRSHLKSGEPLANHGAHL